MSELRLPGGVWTYNPDEQLGPAGGFGAVYAGEGPDHDSVAVKILTAVAEEFGARELSIAEDLADRELAM